MVRRRFRGAIGVLLAAAGLFAFTSPVEAEGVPGARVNISGRAGVPIPGDFNGDGYGDVLFYNAGPGADAFLQGGPSGFSVFIDRYVINGTGYTPLTGDFDGNGTSDILWYRAGTASDFYWYFTPGTGAASTFAATINGTYQVIVDDFDGNGLDDLFWYAPGTAPDFLWYSEAARTYRSTAWTVNGRYIAIGGDFDGNNLADILWYAPGAAADFQWNFRPDGSRASISRTINGVYKPFAGDFDANDVDDIFWYAPGPQADWLWSYQPGDVYGNARVSQSGTYAGIAGNYDADPADEIFWAGSSASEIWTDPPTSYWWTDTFLDNVTVANEGPRTGYSRDLFPHWILRGHGPGNCDTREVVLFRESRTSAKVDTDDCSVDAGRWLSYFDNVTVTSASGLHVDHLVPLAEAWDSGAASWDVTKRRAFANDIDVDYSLVAVTASTNTSKSDRDPAQWQPPYAPARCRYASEWIAVKDRWDLTADPAEMQALSAMLRTCTLDQPVIPTDPKIAPTYYDSTPPPPPSSCSTKGNAYTPANGGCIDRYDANGNGDINCSELPAAAKPVKLKSVTYDPYGLDADRDGWGCE